MTARHNSWHRVMKIVPADAAIADLAKKVAELEKQAETGSERIAAHLGEKAKSCREWIAALKSGRWTS
jgi:prefoldin subunit 5